MDKRAVSMILSLIISLIILGVILILVLPALTSPAKESGEGLKNSISALNFENSLSLVKNTCEDYCKKADGVNSEFCKETFNIFPYAGAKEKINAHCWQNPIDTECTLADNIKAPACDSSLVAYYPLDNDGKDYSVNSWTLTGGTNKFVDGLQGKAYYQKNNKTAVFKSTNTFDDQFAENKVTVSAWVNLQGSGSPEYIPGGHWIVDWHNYNKNAGARLWLTKDGQVRCSIGATNTITSEKISEKEWHFVSYTYDNKTIKIYIDGSEKKTYASAWLNVSGGNEALKIGTGQSASSNNWTSNAYIDEVKIYNRALSEEEIRAIM